MEKNMSTEQNQIITIDDINCCYDRNTTSFHPIEGREKEFEESMRKIEDKYLKDAGIEQPASEEARTAARELFAAALLESTLEAAGLTPNEKELDIINNKNALSANLNNFKKNKKQKGINANMIHNVRKNLFNK